MLLSLSPMKSALRQVLQLSLRDWFSIDDDEEFLEEEEDFEEDDWDD